MLLWCHEMSTQHSLFFCGFFVSVGETVHVLIYRLYVFDEEKTYLLENKEMQEQDVFYI